MKGRKTGGRRPGSLNKARGLGRKREKVRREATKAIESAMPHLQRWLSSDSAWEGDSAAQAARMLDGLMKWVLPRYSAVDAHAEAAEQQAEAQQPVSAADILVMFKRAPMARQPQAVRPAEALEAAQPDGIARLSTAESERLRGQGIPLADGGRLIPASPPMPARREADALPAGMPQREAIDVQPEPRFRLEDFDTSGCIQREPPSDLASLPMNWRR